ncbi:MAG TPA: hypothetical protein VGI21_27135 [Streptosporangiaceae bacterium]
MGSLGGQLAETDSTARDQIAGGFGRWADGLRDGLRKLASGRGSRLGAAANHLAAADQGGAEVTSGP